MLLLQSTNNDVDLLHHLGLLNNDAAQGFLVQHRPHGPMINLSSLFDIHHGTIPPFASNSAVREAMNTTLRRQEPPILRVPVSSNQPFNSVEYRALLSALLVGAIQPEQHYHRALPVAIINGLIEHVNALVHNRIEFHNGQGDIAAFNPMIYRDIIEGDTTLDHTLITSTTGFRTSRNTFQEQQYYAWRRCNHRA